MFSRISIRCAIVLPALIPFTLGGSFTNPISAAPIDWANHLTDAVAEARKSNGLVLVIDLPMTLAGDQNSTCQVRLANEAYIAGTVGSPRMEPHLKQRCVPYKRSVGVPPFVRQRSKNWLPPPAQRPIAYFCTPDLEVVHFVVGYVGADRLAAATQWVTQVCQQAKIEAEADDESSTRTNWFQLAHSDALPTEDIEYAAASANLLRNSKSPLDPNDSEDVRNAIKSVAVLRNKKITDRLRKSFSDRPNAHDVRNVSTDSSFDAAHVSLSMLPGVHLSDLQRPCYELLAYGQCYGSETVRAKTLDAYLAECTRNGQPVLFVIQDKAGGRPLASKVGHEEMLTHPKVKRRLHGVQVVPALPAELSAVHYRRQKSAVQLNGNGTLLFAVFDRRGQLSSTVCSNEVLPLTLAKRLLEVNKTTTQSTR